MMKFKLFTVAVAMALMLGCSGAQNAGDNTVNSQSIPPLSDVTDARQALEIGNQLLEQNETEKAIEAYLRATELDPDLAEAWFKLGVAYALIEKAQEVAAQTDVNAGGDSADPSQRTRTNSEIAFRKAIEAYKKLLENDPENHLAHYDLGRAYNKLNEDADAAKALKQAVRIKPDDTEYQTELGAILIKLAQYREAIPPLRKALELDPENSRAAELLEDAEAGRSRIDYVPPKKDDKNSNSNANTNANVSTNANTPVPQANAGKSPTPRPSPVRRPANRPN